PRFAGFTNTGYFSLLSASFWIFFGSLSQVLRKNVTCFTIGSPAARNSDFMMSLSMPAAEPSTPAPTYGMSASSSRPWIVPSSPKVPCRTGNMMSTLMARSVARRASAGPSKGTSPPPCRCMGSGGTTTASPLANSAAPGVASGSPALRWRASSAGLPCNRRSAAPAVSQRPCLVMPIGTTSYLFLSIALRTEAADRSETSCSPLRPPNRTPTRNLLMTLSVDGQGDYVNRRSGSEGTSSERLCFHHHPKLWQPVPENSCVLARSCHSQPDVASVALPP